MASKYYNPRLAQKVGAATSEQYLSIEPAIEKGRIAYQREEAKQLKKKQLEFEKRKLEATAFAKEMKRRDDVLYTAQKDLYKSEKNFDVAPSAIKTRVTNLLTEAKENTAQLNLAIKNGRVTKGQSVEYTDTINKKVKKAERLLELHPEIIKNYAENKPSMINSSKDILISNKIGAGEFEIVEIKNEDNVIEDQVIVKDDNNKIIATIPLDEAVNPTYIPEDYEAFAATVSTVNEAAKKAASKGESIDNMKQDVKSALSTLNYTPEQSLSIAFDYLGKERPEYINIEDYRDSDGNIDIAKFKKDKVTDLNNDGNIDENELNSWIKSQLVEAAENAYDGYKKDYADKFETDSSKNKDIKLNAEEYVEELNNAMSNYDFSMFNNTKIGGKLITGSEIRNGKLYLEYTARTTAEGQEMAELAGIDLNDKVRLKALLSEYIKGQKGLSISNKISNNITDEMLFTIEDINRQNSILFPSPTTKPQLP